MPTTEFKVDMGGKDAATGEITNALQMSFEGILSVYIHVFMKKVEVKHLESVSQGELLEKMRQWGEANQRAVDLIGTVP
eukprot:CAMPEP_0204600906 /NCGR_PEP_ID=MMETSP0661-20131031/55709_1 /ASSEMBLY_ACC=CAM_ASM_000606 /TAXON_ID=109239 /ORGANISM="Alexandrium margalefi, Strain AMGDE01CS-322" /LENGTH=78 /DNA_ID=CAMNT_0051611741 /DNA_START=40 /DNA_END=276 /DNA_ORIENTATION=-